MAEGQIEVMLDRRLTRDDARGMNEAMSDNLPVTATYSLLFEAGLTTGAAADGPPAPTLAALLAGETINRPVQVATQAISYKEPLNAAAPRVTQTLVAAGGASWPCDLGLDALKLSPRTEGQVRARIARRAFDPRFGLPAACAGTPTDAAVTPVAAVASLFSNTAAPAKGVVPLTLGGDGDGIPAAKVYVPPMEWSNCDMEWPSRPAPPSDKGCVAGGGGGGKASYAHKSMAPMVQGSSDCEFSPGTDWLPGSEDSRPARSAEECCAICTSVSSCKVGVWDGSSACWLKADISGGQTTASSNVISCKVKR